MNYWKLGCRWYSGAPLFFEYLLENDLVISWSDKKYNINDNVLLTDGYTAIGVAKVMSSPTSITDLSEYHRDFNELEIPINDKNLIVFKAKIFRLDLNEQFLYQLQQGICQIQSAIIKSKTKRLIHNRLSQGMMENLNKILSFKSQIILQGPPGTGKTRLAKEIADEILENEIKLEINEQYFRHEIIRGLGFTLKNGRSAKIENIKNDQIFLDIKSTEYEDVLFSFQDVFDCYKNNDYDEIDFVDYNRYAVRSIVLFIIKKLRKVKFENQFKIIQFHPSYTHEDFVRGIIAKSNGNTVEYKNVNKTLGQFAEDALKNLQNSKKNPEVISKEIWVKEKYLNFKELLESELEKSGEFIIKENTKPKITAVEEDSLRINRYSNENDSVLVKDNDIINGYLGLYLSESVLKIRDNTALSKSARSGMYYLYQNIVERFKQYLSDEKQSYTILENHKKEELKSYILVIDEINRANLSSVLGELIYALEYRGEEVESMYEVDGSQKLILPPNLYIIGTMNTADRSVGHIDYAVRRRFAFVDVLPIDLTEELGDDFKKDLFLQVKSIFTSDDYETNSIFMSEEFKCKDVALGHSYFIDKSEEGGDIKTRWTYEIKPILLEYLRDGVLKQITLDKIKEIEAVL
ncbi:AAA family ATPase [Chryseobacterium sp.]|uniref:AAA family ATPase n=1 Tax=Chryseobacterium sp. TaxID=1871047 RepID=UPI00289989EF|nr:AAA family ATPase [Chryseobacterium sp.]